MVKALDPIPSHDASKRVPVCSVKRLLRCLTPPDPSAPSYLNVERGSLCVQDDLEQRLLRLTSRTDAAVGQSMQKLHTVVWSDVGITSSTHGEYLRDLVSDVYSLVVDAVASSDSRPPPPAVVVDVLTQSQVCVCVRLCVFVCVCMCA